MLRERTREGRLAAPEAVEEPEDTMVTFKHLSDLVPLRLSPSHTSDSQVIAVLQRLTCLTSLDLKYRSKTTEIVMLEPLPS